MFVTACVDCDDHDDGGGEDADAAVATDSDADDDDGGGDDDDNTIQYLSASGIPKQQEDLLTNLTNIAEIGMSRPGPSQKSFTNPFKSLESGRFRECQVPAMRQVFKK